MGCQAWLNIGGFVIVKHGGSIAPSWFINGMVLNAMLPMIGESFGWMLRSGGKTMSDSVAEALELAYSCGERAERMRVATEIVRMMNADKESLTVHHPLLILLSKIDDEAYNTVAMLVMHRG